eukprot:TRINITY_DN343_c0_g1_i2.p1 TRINITY_DN343_c0_g1~~TRINITY_DN343_c0_g1_i2.p1  ORF type:complete len:1022 (-),score=230.12 TRINITY_DN343_c0_g1_i2:81-3146(-)
MEDETLDKKPEDEEEIEDLEEFLKKNEAEDDAVKSDENEGDSVESDSDEDEESEDEDSKKQKALRKELAKKDKERLKKIKQKQKQALEELRRKQNDSVTEAADKSTVDRLSFILDQTELFANFIRDGGIIEEKPKSKAKGKGKGKKKGKDDEEELEDEGEDTKFISWFDSSPPFVKGKMRDYQVAGLNWMIRLYESGINGILADEMGLGKTLQSLSFLCYLKAIRGINGPHMIIVPKSTLPNWINEIKRWVPSMRPIGFHGTKDERNLMKNEQLLPGKFDICVTTYEIAIREKAALRKFKWRYIVIDEAHRIKNENSLLSRIVRMYFSQNRLLLTGTPLQNNLHELWALLNFLLPDIFSSSEDWENWFSVKKTEEGEGEVDPQAQTKSIVEKLHKVLRPFLLRRKKVEVEKGLPPKTELKIYVKMTDVQRRWYKRALEKDLDVISSANGHKTRLLNVVMQLRKACCHPYLFPGAEPGPPYLEGEHLVEASGKLVVLDKLLKRLKEKGSRVLIFSQMTKVLDILEDYMSLRGFSFCRIDGQTNHEDRQSQIDAYNAPDSKLFVFLLSTRAGGLGINLATANIVILFDSDWNPQADLQAQDRAHRIGQTKPVQVYRFVTEGSMEEKMVERAEIKLKLDAMVIQQGRLVEQTKALSREELLGMIRFGADAIFQAKDSEQLTDEDIDAILAHGEQKTRELNEKLKKHENDLQDWVLNPDDGKSGGLYMFEGVDYSKYKKNNERTIRERKSDTNYNDDEYYRRTFNKPKRAKGKPKPISNQPWQFCPKKLVTLYQKEVAAWEKRVAYEQERDAKRRLNKEVNENEEEEPDFGELTEEEMAEKEKLIESHQYASWGKREFDLFIRGNVEHGRKNIEDIAYMIPTKTLDQVEQYSEAFWKNYKKITGWERYIENIKKGENRAEIRDKNVRILEILVERNTPWMPILIKKTTRSDQQSQYTQSNDDFLIYSTYKHGYGNWSDVKNDIASCWMFSTDWYFRTRTELELWRRCDTILRIAEKIFEKDGNDE